MKKEYLTPMLRNSNLVVNPLLIKISGDDVDDSDKSKKRNSNSVIDDEIDNDVESFWH